VNLSGALLWGFVATMVLTGIMAAAQEVGISRMSVPFLLGSIFTPHRDRAIAIGSALHALNGWVFSCLYALAFESLHRADVWIGTAFGIAHGLVVLTILMPLLPGIHPRMASEMQGPSADRLLHPPGFMALHYGKRTPIVTLFAHAAYGAILGAFYRLAGGS
jgi:hypothetical protein